MLKFNNKLPNLNSQQTGLNQPVEWLFPSSLNMKIC